MDIFTYLIRNPFAFMGIAWMAFPFIVITILTILSAIGYPEILLGVHRKVKKGGLPYLALVTLCLDLFISCLWALLHLLKLV